jgi:serine protease Do
MRKQLASTLLLPFLAPFLTPVSPAVAQQAQDLTALARRAKHSVVALEILDRFGRKVGTGTGFFIDPEGLIVTNRHVIEGGSRARAVLANRQTLDVTGVVAADEVNDLAIVKVESGSYPALPLGDSSGIEAGLEIVVLGSPLGLAGSLTEGIVSAVRSEGNLPEWHQAPVLQIDAAISPGSSGSPVMNLEGEVVGVAVSQAVFGQNLNFAVPSAAVRELMGAIDLGAPPRPLKAGRAAGTSAVPYLRNLMISIVFFAAIFLGLRFLR